MKSRGDSGVDITQAMDDKVTIVGNNPNLFPSCRKDGAGREKISVESSTSQGVIESKSAYTECEAIDNSGDHHGGSYSIIAMNKFNIDTGSGGINLNSGGNINLMAGGGLVNIVGTECTSVISNVFKCVSSEVSVFKGPELYVETESTLFANTVKLGKNLLVQGGAFINGELFVNHITGPHQIMDTSMSPILPVFFNTPTILTGIVTQTCINPVVCSEGGQVTPASSVSYIEFTLDPMTTLQAQGKVLPHKHTYKHVACDFAQSSSEVWKQSVQAGTNEIISAKETLSFGDLIDTVTSKVQKRITNAFTDTIISLMGGAL